MKNKPVPQFKGMLTQKQRDHIAASFRGSGRPRPSYMAPGTYTQTFTGHPDYVGDYINSHHAVMDRTYYGYTVLSTTAAAMFDGVCVYVTYQIGPPRQQVTPYGRIR